MQHGKSTAHNCVRIAHGIDLVTKKNSAAAADATFSVSVVVTLTIGLVTIT